MKRLLMTLGLTLALVLTVGGLATAAPLSVGDEGSFVVFAEYGNFYAVPVIGAGYTLSDGLAIGGEVYIGSGGTMFGAFLVGAFGPVAVNADVIIESGATIGTASALYMMDLDMLQVGVGGGAFFAISGGSDAIMFVEGALSMEAGDNLSIYAVVDYFVEAGLASFEAGACMSF